MTSKLFNQDVEAKPLTLWLADDDNQLRGLIAELFGRRESIRCTRAFESAEAVLRVLENLPAPDVILLDLNMTGMSGIEAIRLIRQFADRTRIFIMTVFYDSEAEACARKAGAQGFILKRDNWEEIIERLQDESCDWNPELSAAIPIHAERQARDSEQHLPADVEYCPL